MRNHQFLFFFVCILIAFTLLGGCVAVTMLEQAGEAPKIAITIPQNSPVTVSGEPVSPVSEPEKSVPTVPESPSSVPAPTSVPEAVPEVTPSPSPVPALTPEPASTPAPTDPPKGNSVSGTIVSVGTSDLLLRPENGNTINFLASGSTLSGLHAGDSVEISYTGDILNQPLTLGVTVLASAPVSRSTISGTVMRIENSTLYVQLESGNTIGFLLTGATSYTGLYSSVLAGDVVTVLYDGDLLSLPLAVQVVITSPSASRTTPAKPEVDRSLINKHLSGIVTKLTDSKVSVYTSKGKTYSFRLTHKTCYTGGDPLEKGCRIRVTYDGYASNTPNAKVIEVLEPPAPSPTTPPEIIKTTSGTVDSISGTWLILTNGFVCDLSTATVTGTGSPGVHASITYYEKDGTARAIKVFYS